MKASRPFQRPSRVLLATLLLAGTVAGTSAVQPDVRSEARGDLDRVRRAEQLVRSERSAILLGELLAARRTSPAAPAGEATR